MNKDQFNKLVEKNGRLLWSINNPDSNFFLECWGLGNGETFVRQIWPDRNGEVHYKIIGGNTWKDSAKALGLTNDNPTPREGFPVDV